MAIKSSPNSAPEYALHREDIASPDTMSVITKKNGCNSSGYEYVHIQVIPATGVNPNVAVWWWSEIADAFVQENTPITKTGVGAGIGYEFTIQPMGRIFFVQISATTGAVNVAVSGFKRHQFS